MTISVALAYYNGGTYIEEQLDSILCQLGGEDEVVLSVDGAADGSMPLLKERAAGDKRIRLNKGPGRGVVRNFENAIRHCNGDIIYLSDQDDIWKKDKVKKIQEIFRDKEVTAVLHNAEIVDEKGQPTGEKTLFELRGSRPGRFKNLIKNSYVGCCMAFRRELTPLICPIPEEMYMHDFWIGAAAESAGKVCCLDDVLISYRRHSANVTEMHHGSLKFMLRKRVDILRCLMLLEKRVKENRQP